MIRTLEDRALRSSPVPLVTAAEARMLRLPVGTNAYIRVRPGVYADRKAHAALRPWQRYAVRVHALLLTHPDAILCLESAAVVLGLPMFGEPRDLHIYDPDRSASWRFGDVAVHTSADRRTIEVISGIRTTSLLDTVADLGRVLPPAQALAVVDSSISPVQGGTLHIPLLRELTREQKNRRGRVNLRWLWPAADMRSESPAESVSRAVMEWCGFERPVLQQEFGYEGHTDRTDFFFESCRAVGEADGWGKYTLDAPDAAASKLKDEKRREDRLRRHGHPFARWDLSEAWQVDPLAKALRAAKVPQRHAAHPAFLATLRRRPREKRLPS